MSLQKKVLELKLNAAMAARHAAFWQNAIDTQGEEKATAFYKHLGLNHLEEKQFAWEGLSLSRLPRQHEMIAVKGMATAQESAKERISPILLTLRSELITDGLKAIKTLSPADLHALTLRASGDIRSKLKDQLVKVHRQGRMLVGRELERQAGKAWRAEGSWQHPVDFDVVHKRNGFGPHNSSCRVDVPCECKQIDNEDDFDELEPLTDVTTSRVANDVQARIVAATARFTLLGLSGAALLDAVRGEISTGSVSYIDRASTGLANKVINIGREDEAQRRKSEWSRVEYSAILDQNVCGPCAAEDGTEADNEADLTPVPNPDCLGGDWCRCFHVFIAD